MWKEQGMEMTPYKEKGIFRLQIMDDIFQMLEDHQVQLSAMKSTRWYNFFFLTSIVRLFNANDCLLDLLNPSWKRWITGRVH